MTLWARLAVAVTIAVVTVNSMCTAQSTPPAGFNEERGITSYVEFGGTSNSDGQVYRLNSSVGYKFNRHFAVDLGVPVYFVRPSNTLVATGATSENGLGNPYVDLRLKVLSPVLSFGTVLTGYAPVGDSKKGLSTGRATFDWNNRVEHSFSSLTAFLEAGFANTVGDSQFFLRPFTTLGYNTHFQGGASYDLNRFFSVGASGYEIVPFGQQTVFSKVDGKGPNPSGHGVFEDNQQTSGPADIARDNGFSTWIDATPSRYVDLELGYTRSLQFDLNSVSFTIGMNVGKLYRRYSH